MRRALRPLGLLLETIVVLLFATATPVGATTVTGQVKDVNGVPYAGARLTVNLANADGTTFTAPATITIASSTICQAAGLGPAPCQQPIPTNLGPFTLDSGGNIAGGGITVVDVTLITPPGKLWVFTANTPGNPPPLGTGPQTCSATIGITGGAQSVSTNFAACPALGVGGSSSSGSSPPSTAYTFSISAGTVTATPNASGLSTFSGTDAAVVINNALNAAKGTGGQFYFKNGVYTINSLTAETNAGCATAYAAAIYYAIGIPFNASGSWVQFIFEGESKPVLAIGYGFSSIQSNGVIFDVTSTAISGAPAGVFVAGVWQRPGNVGTTCDNAPANAFGTISNDVVFKNVSVRFPLHTRGNEGGFIPWFASSTTYDNVTSYFNENESALKASAPIPGTFGSWGIGTSFSTTAEQQDLRNVFATGFNVCYAINAEHVTGNTLVTEYCNYPADFGRLGGQPIYHPIVLSHFGDYECLHGPTFGPNMVQGSRVDIINYDIEFGLTGWYARSTANLTETNSGYTSGLITYTAVLQGTGVATEVPSSSLFSSGGGNFQAFEGTTAPNIAQIPTSDTFTRANAASVGPAWATNTFSHNLAIVSNTAQVGGGVAGPGYQNYVAQGVNSAQYSFARIGTIDASASTTFIVDTNVGTVTSSLTAYVYSCSNAAATGTQIAKYVSGTPTNLATQTSVSGCATNDTLELRSIPSGSCVTLWAYHNGLLDKNLTNPVSDCSSPLTGGSPGVAMNADVVGGVSAASWSGGSLPGFHGIVNGGSTSIADSSFSNETYGLKYDALSPCATNTVSPAACGAAAAGKIGLPTTITTYTVNTTQVTANSLIFLQPITDNTGIPSAPTCTVPAAGAWTITSRVVGTSFTFALSSSGITCWNFWLVN